jgi:hypothetical protein
VLLSRHFLGVVSFIRIDVALRSTWCLLALLACSSVDDGASPGSAGSVAASGSGALPTGGGGFVAAGGAGASAVAGTSAGGGGRGGGAQGGGGAGSGGPGIASGSGGGGHGGSAGSGGVGGGGTGTGGVSAACDKIRAEFAAELEKQLACTPGAGSQCADRAAAAPGCECRVFIEPSDPFAIEHLSNVANAWFDEDCSMPSCPAQCTTANAGTCQADSKSPKGGRCVTP